MESMERAEMNDETVRDTNVEDFYDFRLMAGDEGDGEEELEFCFKDDRTELMSFIRELKELRVREMEKEKWRKRCRVGSYRHRKRRQPRNRKGA